MSKLLIFFFLYFYFNYSLFAQNYDDIWISSCPDTIQLNNEVIFEASFEDYDDSGTYVDYWNWSINLIHSDSVYKLASEDSVKGKNKYQSEWKQIIETLPLPYDSIKNDNIYLHVNCFDSDSFYHVAYKAFIKLIDSTAVGFESLLFSNDIPENFELYQNYPNPFNPSTTICYSLKKSSLVTLKIYDVLGKKIKILVNEYQNADKYLVKFNASDLVSGIYYYQLQIGNEFVETKKMVLLK